MDGPTGRETTVKAPDGTKLRARYRAVEADELIGSHDTESFEPNPAYPDGVQDRRYEADEQARQRVFTIEARFDPDEYLDPTIQAGAGPSVTLGDAKIVSGFNRYAAARRVYENRPERAEQLKQETVARAEQFGLDPERVQEMDQPLIVRELTEASLREAGFDPTNRDDLAALSSKFNDPISKARDTLGDARVRAKRLEKAPAALEFFLGHIEPDQTLRSFLATAKGRDFVQLLVAHGVITENEAGEFFDAGGDITEQAKVFVEQMVHATVITDPDLLARAPDREVRYLEKSMPAIVQAARVDGYDVRTEVQQALDLLARVQQNEDIPDLETFLQQRSLLEEDQDPLAVAMARFLHEGAGGTYYVVDGRYLTEEEVRQLVRDDPRFVGEEADVEGVLETLESETLTAPVEMRKAFTLFAADAQRAQEAMDARETGDLFGEPPLLPDPAEKFRQRFIRRDYSQPQADVPGLEGSAATVQAELSAEVQPELGEEPAESGDLESRPGVDLSEMSHGDLVRLDRSLTDELEAYNEAVGMDRPQPFSEAQAEMVRNDIETVSRWIWRRTVEGRVARGVDPEEVEAQFGKLWDDFFPEATPPWEREGEVRAEREEQDTRDRSQMAQGDLFGTAAPAEGGEQFKLFGDPGNFEKQGLSEAEAQAVQTVDELAARESDTLTDAERERLDDAVRLLRRSEKFTADEVRQMVRAGTWEGLSERQPQEPGQGSLFHERVDSPEHMTDPDHILNRFIDSLRELDMGGVRHQPAGPFEQRSEAEETALEAFPEGFEEKNVPTRAEIIAELAETLRVPIRSGRTRWRGPGHLGLYKVVPEAIRTQWANDVETAAHEVGHHMHKLLFGEEGLTQGGFLSKKVLSPWREELNALAEGVSDESVLEGEAEFFRLFVTHPEVARDAAPEFYDFVVGTLEETEPAVLEALEHAREKYRRFRAGTAEQRIHSLFRNVNDPTSINFDPAELLNEGYRQWVDQFFPAVRFQHEIAGRTEDVDIDQALEGFLRLTRASSGMAEHWLYKGQFRYDPDTGQAERIGPSLAEILAPVQDEMELFTVWAAAARSLERRQRGFRETGIRDEDASEVFHRYKDRPEFREALRGIQRFRENQLQYLVQRNVLTQETVDRILESSTLYMPFHRAMESQVRKGAAGGHGADVQVTSPIQRFKGSSAPMVHPVDALIQDTFAFMNAAYRQRAADALFELAKERGAAWFAENVATPVEVTNVPFGEAAQQMTEALARREKTGEVNPEVLDQWVGALEELPEGTMMEMLQVFRPGDYWGDRNVIGVIGEDGTRYWFELNDDVQGLYDALTDQEVFHAQGWMAKLLWPGAPARLLRLGATAAPIFSLARNPQRDILTSYVQSEYGIKPAYDHVGALMDLLGKGEWYWRFKRSGGAFAALIDEDRDSLAQAIQRWEEGRHVPGVVANWKEGLRNFSAMIENVSRMAEFKRAYQHWKEQGVSDREAEVRAGLAAREVVVDFARHGAATAAVRQGVAFWNATIQGWDKMIRTFRKHPVRSTARAVKSITIPSMLLFAINADNDDYWETPSWVRNLFWLIPIPDWVVEAGDFVTPDGLTNWFVNEEQEGLVSEGLSPVVERGDTYWLRFAKPHALGWVFGTLPELAMGAALEEDATGLTNALQEFARRTAFEFMPLATAWEGVYENLRNYDLFTQRPLVPQGLQQVEPRKQYTPYTSPTARMIADFVYNMSGETVQVSPIKVEATVQNYTGSLGRDALNLADRFLMEVAERTDLVDEPPGYAPPSGTRFPIVGGALQAAYESQPESVHRFYQEWQEVQRVNRTVGRLKQEVLSGQPEQAEELGRYLREHTRELALYGAYRDVAEQLRRMRNMQETLAFADAPDALQRKLVAHNYRLMARLARGVMQRELPERAYEQLIQQFVPEEVRGRVRR